MGPIEPELSAAIESIRQFVLQTTGSKPSDLEIAGALKRYFVLQEIKAHIEMTRNPDMGEGKQDAP